MDLHFSRFSMIYSELPSSLAFLYNFQKPENNTCIPAPKFSSYQGTLDVKTHLSRHIYIETSAKSTYSNLTLSSSLGQMGSTAWSSDGAGSAGASRLAARGRRVGQRRRRAVRLRGEGAARPRSEANPVTAPTEAAVGPVRAAALGWLGSEAGK